MPKRQSATEPEHKPYYVTVTEEYNKWMEASIEAWDEENIGTMDEMALAAFMCNAISSAVLRSTNLKLKKHFQEHAITD